MKLLFPFAALLLLASCGKNSPWSSKYSEEAKKPGENVTGNDGLEGAGDPVNGSTYSITLTKISTVAFKKGSAHIHIDNKNVEVSINFDDIPANFQIVGTRLVLGGCPTSQIQPPASWEVLKDISYKENAARTAVFPGLIEDADIPQFSLIIDMSAKGVASTIPVACGPVDGKNKSLDLGLPDLDAPADLAVPSEVETPELESPDEDSLE